MATPHIAADPGDIAPVVLMPGDPKRAERMAAAILTDAKLVTDTRGALGFTGAYAGEGPGHGQPLSIMTSGMGMASMGIYATELFKVYDVQRIVRVGTAGALHPTIEVGSVIIAVGAHACGEMNEVRIPGVHFSAVADLPMAAAALAARGDKLVRYGSVLTTDHFYFTVPNQSTGLIKHHALGIDMETAGLYGVAAEFGRRALAVLTVSDNLVKKGLDMDAATRESTFQDALDLAVAAAFCD